MEFLGNEQVICNSKKYESFLKFLIFISLIFYTLSNWYFWYIFYFWIMIDFLFFKLFYLVICVYMVCNYFEWFCCWMHKHFLDVGFLHDFLNSETNLMYIVDIFNTIMNYYIIFYHYYYSFLWLTLFFGFWKSFYKLCFFFKDQASPEPLIFASHVSILIPT